MFDRKTWETWCDATAAVDAALGLALLADYECADSLVVAEERVLARQALSSAICGLLKKSAALLAEIEPKTAEEQA